MFTFSGISNQQIGYFEPTKQYNPDIRSHTPLSSLSELARGRAPGNFHVCTWNHALI
jgi:hypothetical protein